MTAAATPDLRDIVIEEVLPHPVVGPGRQLRYRAMLSIAEGVAASGSTELGQQWVFPAESRAWLPVMGGRRANRGAGSVG